VTTGVGGWLGRRLIERVRNDGSPATAPEGIPMLDSGKWPRTAGSGKWPRAASGGPGALPRAHDVSAWPERHDPIALSALMSVGNPPLLSTRAAAGFLRRLEGSGLPFDSPLREALQAQVAANHPAPRRARPLVSAAE